MPKFENQICSDAFSRFDPNSCQQDQSKFDNFNPSNTSLRTCTMIDYEAEECIGKGTFGRVLRAKAFAKTYTVIDQYFDCINSSNSNYKNIINEFNVNNSNQLNNFNNSNHTNSNGSNNNFAKQNQCKKSIVTSCSESQYKVAIKVLRSKVQCVQQAKEEIEILKMLECNKKRNFCDDDRNKNSSSINKQLTRNRSNSSSNNNNNIIRLLSSFLDDAGELCIVFELLQFNLFEYMKHRAFNPLPLHEIRLIIAQLCVGLSHLHCNKVIHTDLKPENIMLVDMHNETLSLRIIDLGSACLIENSKNLTYLQSRYYRSPEILMALPFTTAVDIWSLGCVAVELYLGSPLYPGYSEYDQIRYILSTQGQLPKWMMKKSKKLSLFFDQNYQLRSVSDIMEKFGKKFEAKETRKYIMKDLSSLIVFKSPDNIKLEDYIKHLFDQNNTSTCQDVVISLINFYTQENFLQKNAFMEDFNYSTSAENNFKIKLATQKSLSVMNSLITERMCEVNQCYRENSYRNYSGCSESQCKSNFVEKIINEELLARKIDKISFIKLIISMMQLDPSLRLSSQDILNSDFLKFSNAFNPESNYLSLYNARALDFYQVAYKYCNFGEKMLKTNSLFHDNSQFFSKSTNNDNNNNNDNQLSPSIICESSNSSYESTQSNINCNNMPQYKNQPLTQQGTNNADFTIKNDKNSDLNYKGYSKTINSYIKSENEIIKDIKCNYDDFNYDQNNDIINYVTYNNDNMNCNNSMSTLSDNLSGPSNITAPITGCFAASKSYNHDCNQIDTNKTNLFRSKLSNSNSINDNTMDQYRIKCINDIICNSNHSDASEIFEKSENKSDVDIYTKISDNLYNNDVKSDYVQSNSHNYDNNNSNKKKSILLTELRKAISKDV